MSLSKRTLERVLLAIGVALCLVYAVGIAFRSIGSSLAIRAFRNSTGSVAVQKEGPGGLRWPNSGVDYSLWSPKRIAAYEDALAHYFTPPLAILRVPRLGIEAPVFEGTDELALNRGIGHIIGTPAPGQPGNIGIAGHRDGFFRKLKDIHEGDSVTLDTGRGVATYVVDHITIVDPTDVSVLAQTPTPSITLVTCFPFYFVGDAPKRYIIRCSLKDNS